MKALKPSPTATLHSSSSLFHLPQSDQMFYLLSMSITLFYLHSARKHCKNMGIWEQESNMKHLQSGCNHVQHIQVASSNLLAGLWHLALKFVLLCLQKSENQKKKIPTISITWVTISNKKWFEVLCIWSKDSFKSLPQKSHLNRPGNLRHWTNPRPTCQVSFQTAQNMADQPTHWFPLIRPPIKPFCFGGVRLGGGGRLTSHDQKNKKKQNTLGFWGVHPIPQIYESLKKIPSVPSPLLCTPACQIVSAFFWLR